MHESTPPSPSPSPVVFIGPDGVGPEPPLAPAFRGGTLTLPCELRAPQVLRCYRRDFTTVSLWLQALNRTRPIGRITPRTIDDAEQAIVTHLMSVRGDFERLTQEADTLMAAHGLGHVTIRHAAAVTVAAPIVHPIARLFLDALSAADDTFVSLERAWLMGLLDSRDRRLQEARGRKALHSLAASVRTQHSEMARRVRAETRTPTLPTSPHAAHGPAAPESSPVAPPDRLDGPVTPWWSGSHAGGPFAA